MGTRRPVGIKFHSSYNLQLHNKRRWTGLGGPSMPVHQYTAKDGSWFTAAVATGATTTTTATTTTIILSAINNGNGNGNQRISSTSRPHTWFAGMSVPNIRIPLLLM